VFQNRDVERLEVELVAAIKRLEQLPFELAEKNQYIGKLNRSLDRSRVRVEDMHNRVVAIRKRFGVKPAKPEVDGRDIADDVD
jgi:predicted  nucleic acid-binding Zn-ribbon protein